MNTVSMRGVVGAVVAIAMLATPAFAAAGSASVLTQQVVPQGSSSCAPLFASSVTPYIYDGELDSFDIVLSDPSYVGVLGAAGDVSIPFNYMTRRIESDGSLRLHVDTTVQVQGNLPVTVTLLSAPVGGPVCLSTVSFTTDRNGTIETSNPISVPTTIGSSTTTPSSSSGAVSVITGGTHTGRTSQGTQVRPIVGSTTSTSTSIGEIVAKMCTKNGAYQLWFILLAIFFVIAAFVGLSEPAIALRHGALPVVLIGIPLAGLLLFWYYASDCRLSWFIPLILVVAAIIGLYSAYRTSPIMRPMVELPPAEKKSEVQK